DTDGSTWIQDEKTTISRLPSTNEGVAIRVSVDPATTWSHQLSGLSAETTPSPRPRGIRTSIVAAASTSVFPILGASTVDTATPVGSECPRCPCSRPSSQSKY